MNCKPGDLAVIVRDDFNENVGALVKVIDLPKAGEFSWEAPWLPPTVGPSWEVLPLQSIRAWDECEVVCHTKPGETISIEDRFLRSIRENDGEDEMLRIVGKPQEVKA